MKRKNAESCAGMRWQVRETTFFLPQNQRRNSPRLGELSEALALVPDRLLVLRQARLIRAASAKASEIEQRTYRGAVAPLRNQKAEAAKREKKIEETGANRVSHTGIRAVRRTGTTGSQILTGRKDRLCYYCRKSDRFLCLE
ncbi:zinc-binding dehydrogenase [Pseudozyma hubeiensis SY62]|uniref:Zinc-binding dehydrogenase n=1 Tax=Pseudozyma hubeiensis (strain SY62) TaxID=1305764 RepID=R9P256_PSEHS|nr:zinc-binding dehydrogenase [Pseudozyma hubeiensis SY62]GAC95361.1 zinc-binding dehydrogenase [Pseudozyma hubeiensis SY62]